jgi:hypothetical protein
MLENLQEQQKNIMEQVGQQVQKFKYSKIYLGGAGTQTAGLAFGGNVPPKQAATEEYNGT